MYIPSTGRYNCSVVVGQGSHIVLGVSGGSLMETKSINCKHCGKPFEVSIGSSWNKLCIECVGPNGEAKSILLRYGITYTEYRKMIDEQGGLCAICQRKPAKFIDHCHTTNVIRGVLCPACNTAIGQIDADPRWAVKAIEYRNATHVPRKITKYLEKKPARTQRQLELHNKRPGPRKLTWLKKREEDE